MTELPATATMVAFAKLHGISRSGVYKWKARGLIAYTADGLVDVAASNARLADRPAAYRGGRARGLAALVSLPEPQADSEGWTMTEAVRRERVAAAKLRELELAREAGLVVPVSDVVGAVSAEYHIVRTALLGMPSKLAHRLAVASTPEECGALVDTEVRQILTELTRDTSK